MLDDKGQRIGRIGAAVRDDGHDREALFVTVHRGVFSALGRAFAETWDGPCSALRMAKMVTGSLTGRNISGPVTIMNYAGKSAKLGVVPISILALVSIAGDPGSAAHSGSGWGAFAVLSRGSHRRRPVAGTMDADRPEGRIGVYSDAHGVCFLQ